MPSTHFVTGSGFQDAWHEGAKLLANEHWEVRNLIVQIDDPTAKDGLFHARMKDFSIRNGLLGPKHVAYTIFPHKLYERYSTYDNLCRAYNRRGGLYERLRSRPRRSWGTYFRRMTHYECEQGRINQLANIISAINDRSRLNQAAYTIVIQKPGGETIRPRGGPCLNYISVQLAKETNGLSLLCIYRNHDYLERAYGNYWGLCNLCCFLARETSMEVGSIVVVSSHAYVGSEKRALSTFLQELDEISRAAVDT